MLDFKDLLTKSIYKRDIKKIIDISHLAFKNWGTYWTDFIPSHIYKEILKKFNNLDDLSYSVYGGYDNADRVKIACTRKSINKSNNEIKDDFPAIGIDIKGNFLFDNASQTDFRNLIKSLVRREDHIGDIWTLGDRGAQGIVDIIYATQLNGSKSFLRDVEVGIKIVPIESLRLPSRRVEKYISTVEASKRLDAVASAGFRVSRNKINEQIKNGFLIVNGLKIYKPTYIIKKGDIIQLENKGLVEILSIEITKRERWKITLIKN